MTQFSNNKDNQTFRPTAQRIPGGRVIIAGLALLALAGLILYFLSRSKPTPSPAPKPLLKEKVANIPRPSGAPSFPVEEVPDPQTGQKVPVAADRLIVRFKKGVSDQARQELWKSLGGIEEKDLGLNMYNVFFPAGADLEKIRQEFEKSPLVKYSERDGVIEIFYTPNDYGSPNRGGLDLLKSQAAWEYSRGDAQTVVAVLDTAVKQGHPDLPNVQIYQALIPYSNPPSTMPGAHATHVAGTACAITDNNTGVASTCFTGSIWGIQALYNNGGGTNSSVAAAINKAVEQAADQNRNVVINMSLGGKSSSRSVQDAVNNAWNNGVLIIASAGNDGSTAKNYPAAFQNVLSVAATSQTGNTRAYFSTYGSWVDVAAPGVDIYSTMPSGYGSASGTSMASPNVASLAALCWSAQPSLTNQEVLGYILDNAVANSFTKHGLVNAEETLKDCGTLLPTPTIGPSPTPIEPLSCYPIEWKCRDNDIARPDIWCCKQPCFLYPPDQDSACRTNQDRGQKDGTGYSQLARRYPYFDYELQKVVQVPPALGLVAGPTPLPTPTPGNPTCAPQCPINSGYKTTSFCQNITYAGNTYKHRGVDIGGSEGAAVNSAACGTVVRAGFDKTGYGNWIKVNGSDGNTYIYAHLASTLGVGVGDSVSAGQPIGSVGNICDSPPGVICTPSDNAYDPSCSGKCKNGRSSGAHLHFEIQSPNTTDQCETGGNQINPGDIIPGSCVGATGTAQIVPGEESVPDFPYD